MSGFVSEKGIFGTASWEGSMRPAARHLFELALRRAVLAASRNIGDQQGIFDCGEMALALGLREEARLFFEVAFIAGGYDDIGLNAQNELRNGTGLWEHVVLRPTHKVTARRTHQERVNAAVATLRACLDLIGDAPPSPGGSGLWDDERSNPAIREGKCSAAEAADLFSAVHAFHLGLLGPFKATDLASATAAVCQHPFVAGTFRVEDHVDAPLDILAALLASEAMRHFLRQRYDLVVGRLASPALLHAAAGLNRGDLGPYFSGAANLGATLSALIGLALAATGRTALTQETEHAILMLSSGLQTGQLRDFVHMLADHGAVGILHLIANRFGAVLVASEKSLCMSLRDAAIDLAENELAVHLQGLLCTLSPHSDVEERILLELKTDRRLYGYGSSPGLSNLRRARRRALDPAQTAGPD